MQNIKIYQNNKFFIFYKKIFKIFSVGPKWFMGRARLPVKGARGPSQGKAVAQARCDNLAIQPRTVLSSANPTSHQSEGQKGYRTKLERAPKISRESCPYCHLILCTWQNQILWFYNHPQRLWVWTDGTSINFGKFKPTRGRRTASTGWYKRKSKWSVERTGKNGQKPEPPSPPPGERLQGWK